VYIAVSTQYRSVTDRRTDRQTSCDSIVCAICIASRGIESFITVVSAIWQAMINASVIATA